MFCKLDWPDHLVSLSQDHVHDLLDEYGLSNCKPVSVPYGSSILGNDVHSPANESHDCLSICTTLMCLDRISRPDILCTVSCPPTKGLCPTLAYGILSSSEFFASSQVTPLQGKNLTLSLTRTQVVVIPARMRRF